MEKSTGIRLTLYVLCLCIGCQKAQGPDNKRLPAWASDVREVDRLGEAFCDERICIRPPQDMQKIEIEVDSELAKAGVHAYGWSPGGVFPSSTNFSVALTSFAKPSSFALDETLGGMKDSFERNFQRIRCSKTERGLLRGDEVLMGAYEGDLSGEFLYGIYLIGIDDRGTFTVSTMLPKSDATPERLSLLKSAMLTFNRPK